MASTAKNFEEVFGEELHEIRYRRKVCNSQSKPKEDQEDSGSDTSLSDEDSDTQLREELVGLALSGGGVRSAAFNLGLLQSLYQKGRMKDVDYLSTVSGGGYAGALFSASVANDKDGVNWDRESQFNRLPIEPDADGSQPPRIYELALHGRALSRPIQWLSRHLWGWILTILFVISGVIAIAAVLAWLMRIVWSHENLRTVQSLGFATDLHIIFFPAFLALLLWAFCNICSVIMRALGVRIPPISRYAYVLLLVSLVLGAVSFLAIGDFNMSDYVSADLVPIEWSRRITDFLHYTASLALGLLSFCLLPFLVPHKLLQSGRNRDKPFQKFAFNIGGFAIICGVPLAVFYMLARENVSSYNLQRPNSDMITQSHLANLEKFIPYLDSQKPLESEPNPNLRDQISKQLDAAVDASGEEGNYPHLRREIVDNQRKGSIPSRLLQYLASQLGLHEGFKERVENRRNATISKEKVAKYINNDVLTNPNLFEDWSNNSTSTTESEETDSILNRLNLAKSLDAKKRSELEQLIDNIRAPRKVLKADYGNLVNPFELEIEGKVWWGTVLIKELESIYPEVELAENKDPEAERAENKDSEKKNLKQFRGTSKLDEATLRALLIASVLDDQGIPLDEPNASTSRTDGTDPIHPDKLISRGFTKLQALLHLDSSSLVDKLDDKLELVFGDERKSPEFLATFKELHEAEKQHVDSQLNEIRTSNWAVLAAMYPDFIRTRETVYAWNVNAADQVFRLQIAGYSILVFLFVGLLANLNIMCLHSVYRDQLAAVWLPTGPLLLKDLNTCRYGAPLHLFNATLNRHGKKLDPDAEGMSRFVLSSRFCGSKRFGYRETWEYENGEIGVADAVAISGAAVSTSYTGDLLFRTILFLTNFRLGQWVRNPKHFYEEHYWPSPLRILISSLWHPTDRSYVDLSDGGHLDNTGLSSLLERRCRLMILGDCSQDPNYQFDGLFAVLQAARAKYGIQIVEVHAGVSPSDSESPLGKRSNDQLARLKPDESNHFESQSHFAIIRLRYPEKRTEVRHDDRAPNREAILIVIKPTLTGDEPADLIGLRRRNGGFPNDSTVNQFLEPSQFESYVKLGSHIGDQLDQFILDGDMDQYQLPAPWCSQKMAEPTSTIESTDKDQPETESKTDEMTADSDLSSSQPKPSAEPVEFPSPYAVSQLLESLSFDKPGIGVAIALIRQWAEAQYENDQNRLSARSDIFDHIVGPAWKWSVEQGEYAPVEMRRLFCRQLMAILDEHTWIAKEADEEIRNEFREMLEAFGEGVPNAGHAVASLSPNVDPAPEE